MFKKVAFTHYRVTDVARARKFYEETPKALLPYPTISSCLERTRLAQFANDQRIPVISGWGEFAQSGGLMTYGPNSTKFFRRLADYAKKIVNGAKPSEIPIEQPTTFELMINLKTAKSIGLSIPPTLIARAAN